MKGSSIVWAAMLGGMLMPVYAGPAQVQLEADPGAAATAARARSTDSWLGRATAGVLELSRTGERFHLTFDREALVEARREAAGKVRHLAERWFPDEACQVRNDYGVKLDPGIPPEHLVILVHGLDEPGQLWSDVRPAIEEQGHAVAEFRYPNDQPIAESAAFLASELARLRRLGVFEVTLISHSMGGLVCRETLTSPRFYAGRAEQPARLPKVRRLIQTAPPNHGSHWARLRWGAELRDQFLHWARGDYVICRSLFDGAGEAGMDLVPGSNFLEELASRELPDVPITIIAAQACCIDDTELDDGIGWLQEYAPDALDGVLDRGAALMRKASFVVGDGVVSPASAKLDGVEDFHLVEANHHSVVRNLRRTSERTPPAIPIIIERLGPAK